MANFLEKLKKGIAPFYEPGLSELVKRNVDAKRLIFTLDYKEAVSPSEIIFICVGTPSKENGEADLSSVLAAAEAIGKSLAGYKVVVTKSTVPPGTNKKVADIINRVKPEGASFAIASVPEFLREGTAIADTLHPDRVVIGTTSDRAQAILLELHKPINGKTVLLWKSCVIFWLRRTFTLLFKRLDDQFKADTCYDLFSPGIENTYAVHPAHGYGSAQHPVFLNKQLAELPDFLL